MWQCLNSSYYYYLSRKNSKDIQWWLNDVYDISLSTVPMIAYICSRQSMYKCRQPFQSQLILAADAGASAPLQGDLLSLDAMLCIWLLDSLITCLCHITPDENLPIVLCNCHYPCLLWMITPTPNKSTTSKCSRFFNMQIPPAVHWSMVLSLALRLCFICYSCTSLQPLWYRDVIIIIIMPLLPFGCHLVSVLWTTLSWKGNLVCGQFSAWEKTFGVPFTACKHAKQG